MAADILTADASIENDDDTSVYKSVQVQMDGFTSIDTGSVSTDVSFEAALATFHQTTCD